MGFDIRLEDEHGELIDELSDPQNLLHQLLPRPDDDSFSCLRFVDPYGDTTFNRLQSEALLEELTRLRSRATTDQAIRLLAKLHQMAQRCREEPHLYIKFYGD